MMKRSVPALLIKELAYEICIIYIYIYTVALVVYQPAVWDAPGNSLWNAYSQGRIMTSRVKPRVISIAMYSAIFARTKVRR